MTATPLHRNREFVPTADPPLMVDGIGAFGWLCLFAIALVAVLLVAFI